MKNKRLKKSLRDFSQKKEDKVALLMGELGIPLNGDKIVEVPGRAGFVFVRLKGNTSELIQAYNAVVSPIYGLPVLLARQGNIYKIVGRDLDRYRDWGDEPYLPKHGTQHSFNHALNMGGDITWVYSQQFMPLLAYPSGTDGGMYISINPHFYEWNGEWKYAQNTGTPSFAPYLPTTGSRMCLYYIQPSDNSLQIVPGTPFSISITGSAELAQYIPDIPRSVGIPVAAVRLTTGTTSIGWDNIYDVRDFYTVGTSSGSAGGGGGGGLGIVGWDEGVYVGTGTVLNVAGAGATLTLSGTVFNLNIPGGGSSFAGVDQIGIYALDDGTPVGSGSTVNFGNNLSVSRTGTTLFVDAIAGVGGGGAGVMIWDEGVPKGTGTVLNFVGTNIDASISGSVARIFVTGSGGGITIDQSDPYGIFHRLSGSSADDDEFSNDTLASYTLVAPTGMATGTIANHVLSATFSGQSANDICAFLKAMTLADGEWFETVLRMISGIPTSTRFSMAGLVVTDGITTTSNALATIYYISSAGATVVDLWKGTLTNINTNINTFTISPVIRPEAIRLQLKRTSSTSWNWLIGNKDGAQVSSFGTTGGDPGFTPTHAGVFVSTWGGSHTAIASFDFIRKMS